MFEERNIIANILTNMHISEATKENGIATKIRVVNHIGMFTSAKAIGWSFLSEARVFEVPPIVGILSVAIFFSLSFTFIKYYTIESTLVSAIILREGDYLNIIVLRHL